MIIGSTFKVIAGHTQETGPGTTRSLQFRSANSEALYLSHANWGTYDRDKFAISAWFRRNATFGQHGIFTKTQGGGPTTTEFWLIAQASGIDFAVYTTTNTLGRLTTNDDYDDNDWHQVLVHYDGQNATAGDRMRMWIDGSEITSFATDTNPDQNPVNTASSVNVAIGAYQNNSTPTFTGFCNGFIFQPAFFSGVLPSIDSFYSSGSPVNITGISGRFSHLKTDGVASLEDDDVISTNWTNVNTVVDTVLSPTTEGLPSSLVFHLDLGHLDSYGGSGQTLANRVASPADGESQTAYDHHFGDDGTSDTTDPTFTGTAGALDTNVYASVDGGDYFDIVGSLTTFLNSMHKDSALFTIVMLYRSASSLGQDYLFSTDDNTSGTGITFRQRNNGWLQFWVGNNNTNSVLNVSSSGITIATSSIQMVAISVDEASGSGASLFYVKDSGGTKTTDTFDATYSSPSSSAADGCTILATPDHAGIATSGVRLFDCMAFNTALTESDLDDVYDMLSVKF
jgi:hypothetical protein